MDKDLFFHYAELKIQEKRLKKEISELAPVIQKQIEETSAGSDQVPKVPVGELGALTLARKKVWTFPPGLAVWIERTEMEIESRKEEAKANGTATAVEKSELKFFEKKAGDKSHGQEV